MTYLSIIRRYFLSITLGVLSDRTGNTPDETADIELATKLKIAAFNADLNDKKVANKDPHKRIDAIIFKHLL